MSSSSSHSFHSSTTADSTSSSASCACSCSSSSGCNDTTSSTAPTISSSSDSASASFPTSSSSSSSSSSPASSFSSSTTTSFESPQSVVDKLTERSASKALASKTEGNRFFAEQKYELAIEKYSEALLFCPEEDKSNRAIYLTNRAACYLQLNKYDQVVEDCSLSLQLTPNYLKTLLRRAQAFEALDKVPEALEDWKSVLKIEPTRYEAQEKVRKLGAEAEKRQEKMKTEMMGKLKDLGNTILGKFGLSLDNFKATQDPKTGSYSINFSKQ
eukprot:TRINITY_DN66_c0_g1_i1.p1 TRINITY_DN66_c0_g1~~TRINITY_DN66_c0_g1_i1.p1  ORF type:complete len:271 (+),score=98.61 TRINITY_DN66_c0_g1_i1:73-885(+)